MARANVTMKEVADRVGVSKMTVSAVLSGKSDILRISAATQARVLAVARELGYSPNAVARSLRQRRTNVIGLYCGHGYLNAHLPFLAEIIGGVQEGCDRHHKDVLLHGVFRGAAVDDIYAELADGRIDGLIVNAPPLDPLVDRLAVSHLPVVAIADAIAQIPSVVVDDAGGVQMALAYLASRGHRRIFYRHFDRPLASAERRRSTVRQLAAEKDFAVTEWRGPDRSDPADSMLDFLDMPAGARPTAALCWNDLTAYDLVARCRARGARVPEDLAVVSFDGIETPSDRIWRLTSVRAPWAAAAHKAVELVLAMLAGEDVPLESTLPVEFVVGDSA